MVDEALICNDFEGAKDPAAQVRIISELHLVDVRKVQEVLRRHGYIVPDKIPKLVCKADSRGAKTGVRPQIWSDAHTEMLHRLVDRDLTTTQIAAEMRRGEATIRRKCREYGLHPRDGRKRIDCDLLRELAASDLSVDAIAQKMGFTVETIRMAASRAKIKLGKRP